MGTRGRTWIRKTMIIVMAVVMALGLQLSPMAGALGDYAVYASTVFIKVEPLDTMSVMQGSTSEKISFRLTTQEAGISFDSAEFSAGTGVTATSAAGGNIPEATDDGFVITFVLDISKTASEGDRSYSVKLKNVKRNGTTEETEREARTGTFTIYEKMATPDGGSGKYVAAVDIIHKTTPESGFAAGTGNEISFELFNRGNTVIKDAQVSLTLPDGLAVYNDSNSVSLGYISTGTKKTTKFPITVSDTIAAGNYAITMKLSGLDYSNNAVSTEKTFYIPVAGGGSSISASNLAIENISIPAEVTGTDPFTLTFNVRNTSKATVKNMKVHVEVPEGLLNRTTTTFIENTFDAGATKSYSVSLFASDTSGKTFPIKIAVDPVSTDATTAASNVLQYASVYVKGDSTNAKTPQLMVDRYTYGGSSVQAGTEFALNLGLFNTSGKTISNIKVTVASEDGTFVPVDSSNSFFVDSIGPKKHFTQAMYLSSKPLAEQKTTALTVTMKYEADGNAYESADSIAIPVTQETKLVVDEIVPPYEVYVGEMGSAEVAFYNTGKNTINNLSVNVEGNFDVMQSNRYYVGNMESGKSDSYTFTYVPRETGPMEGTITFTYEDSSGQEQYLEMPFTFEVIEMPVFEDPNMLPEEQTAKPWGLIIGGSAIVLVVAGLIIWRKIRKKKLHKAMEILDAEDSADFDLEDKEPEQPEAETQPESQEQGKARETEEESKGDK